MVLQWFYNAIFIDDIRPSQVITVVLVLYFAIRAAIHASEWLCAPASTRRARSWMLRAATAREYKAAEKQRSTGPFCSGKQWKTVGKRKDNCRKK